LFPPFLIPRYSNLFDQLSLELFVNFNADVCLDDVAQGELTILVNFFKKFVIIVM
jgi:hypothetical protein